MTQELPKNTPAAGEVYRHYKEMGSGTFFRKRGFVSFPITTEARHRVDSIVASVTQPHFKIDLYPAVEEKNDMSPDSLAVFIEKTQERDHQRVIKEITQEFFKVKP